MLHRLRSTPALALLFALALTPRAGAQEVPDGLAARVTPQGLEFAAGLVSGLKIQLPSLPLQFTVDRLTCEYHLTIHEYEGEAEIGEVHLGAVEGSPDHLAATGAVVSLDVWNIVIEATSPDWWCPNYNEEDHDVIVSSLSADDTSFILRAAAEVQGQALEVEVLDSSSVYLGDVQIETTQWYLPEELIEAAIESLEDKIEQFILDEAADLLAALLFDLPSAGVIAGFGYDARIAQLSIDGDGLVTQVDTQVEYVDEPGDCAPGSPDWPAEVGQPGQLSSTSGDLQLAITQELANAVVAAGWQGGLLCQEFQHLDFSSAAPLFPALENEDGVRFGYEVTRQPTVTLSEGVVGLDLPGVWLELVDTDGGETLFWADMAVSADVALGIDEQREVVTLSLMGADLEFLDLDASGLLHGTNYTEQAFLQLIDEQVLLLLPDQLSDLPIAPLSFGITGLHTEVVEGLTESLGGRILGVDVFDGVAHAALEALVSVDDIPPWVEILTDLSGPRTANEIAIEYAGEDDRGGPLAYSWRLDDGAWSFWSEETTASFVLVDEGTHTFQVRARDTFWNESSAATATFVLDLDGEGAGDDDGEGNCKCTTSAAASSSVAATVTAALALSALLARRRTDRA